MPQKSRHLKNFPFSMKVRTQQAPAPVNRIVAVVVKCRLTGHYVKTFAPFLTARGVGYGVSWTTKAAEAARDLREDYIQLLCDVDEFGLPYREPADESLRWRSPRFIRVKISMVQP